MGIQFATGTARNKWLLWRLRWVEDQPREVQELAKTTAKSIFIEAAALPIVEAQVMGRWAERSLSRDRINAMLELAKSDPRIRMTTDQFDRDPFLLNFANSTFDIRTATLREHRREDYITRLVPYDYIPDLVPPRWLLFLKQTFGELDDWIQKAVGYSLTGAVNEKAAFLLLGPTNCGKTTFLTTLREIFKDYSAILQIETLMAARETNNTQADLASLLGARFVITSETEEFHKLRESKLKLITAGMGEISTTRKYENPVVFTSTGKVWIDANHAPAIRATDDSVWLRLLPVPCRHQVIDGKDLDRNLPNKLLHEAPAIVSWAVAGAVRWFKEGLGRPEAIIETRNEWRGNMDVIGQFVSDCCLQEPDASVRASEFYEAFKTYCQKQGHEHVITAMAFALRLAERGYQKHRDMKGVIYRGLKLKGGLF